MPSTAQLVFPAVPDGPLPPVPRRVAPSRSSTLLALERALAAQDEELELAFAAFRDLARRQDGLRLPVGEWEELTGSLAALSAHGGANERPMTGFVPAAGTRC